MGSRRSNKGRVVMGVPAEGVLGEEVKTHGPRCISLVSAEGSRVLVAFRAPGSMVFRWQGLSLCGGGDNA